MCPRPRFPRAARLKKRDFIGAYRLGHAAYPADRFRSPKVTVFVAMLTEAHKRMARTKLKRP